MVSQVTKFVVLALAILLVCNLAEATYRKPPFNGSIFGKRANQAGMEKTTNLASTHALKQHVAK